jgi:hypothetical protein
MQRMYLVSHILFKILVSGHIQTHTTVLQPFSLDFVFRARNGRHDNVRKRKTFPKCQRAWVDNVTRVIPS